MQIVLSNQLDEIARVMGEVDDFLVSQNASQAARQAVELSLDELLTNTISYGYSSQDPHRIHIDMAIDGAMLSLTLQDDAVAFDPFSQAEPNIHEPLETREIGGLGIHFVKKFMDDFSYQRINNHNVIKLHKRIAC